MSGFDQSDLTHALGQSSGSSVAPGNRSRLRFTAFDFERSQSGHCSARVELEWIPGESVSGRAQGLTSPMGDLRVAAEAAIRAIEQFTGKGTSFELLGVKSMRAFDASVVMVSVLSTTSEGQRRLLGCHLCDDDHLRGAVIATLQATNRLLGNAIATR
ncbi:MAG: hypothetical protein ACT4OZ_10610 [Gemmatimonadota bacterium]